MVQWLLRLINGSIDREIDAYYNDWCDGGGEVQWIMTWPNVTHIDEEEEM